MSQNDTRKVTIRINGKEIENTMRSIREETRKLRNEINNKLIPGTEEYNRKVKELQKLDGVIQKHNNELKGTTGLWGSITKEIKQFGLIAATYMGGQAIISGMGNMIKGAASLDEQFTDVAKVTGMTKLEVRDLASELSKIDTRSSRSELLELAWVAGKLGIQAKEDILGFVRAADQIQVALGKDLGSDALQDIGKLVSIFKLDKEFGIEQGMLKIASAVNEIGMASTASEGNVVNFLKRMGGVAAIAEISSADILALGGTLDSLGQSMEMSATAMSKTIMTMAKETEAFAKVAKMDVGDFEALMRKDVLGALMVVLEEAGKTKGGIQNLASTFSELNSEGGRIISVLGTLSKQIPELKRQQEIANKAFDDGTSASNEFNLKNQTLEATLAKLGKAMRKELIQPALIDFLQKGVIWIGENFTKVLNLTKAVIKLVAVFLTYKGVIAAITAIQKAYVAAQAAGVTLTNAQIAAAVLLSKVKLILSANISRAAKAQQLFNLVSKMNPYVFLVGVIAAAATAFYLFGKRVKEASAAQKHFNDAQKTANKNVAEEKARIDVLVKAAKDQNLSYLERKKAIETLNKISPEYLGNLTLENIKTAEGAKLIDAYVESLNKKAMAEALMQKKTELAQRWLDAQNSSLEEHISAKDVLASKLKNIGDKEAQLAELRVIAYRNRNELIDSIEEEQKELDKLAQSYLDLFVTMDSNPSMPDLEIDETITKTVEVDTSALEMAQKEIQGFYDFLDKMDQESTLRSLNARKSEILNIRLKYAEQLEIAKKHFGEESLQYKTLLELRNEEIEEIELKYRQQFYEKYMELKNEMDLLEIENEREKAMRVLALQEEADIEKLREFEDFEELKYLTEQKYRMLREQMNKEFDEREKEQQQQKLQIQLRSLHEFTQAHANLLGSLGDMLNENTGAWKTMKIAEAKISAIAAAQRAYEEAMKGTGPLAPIIGGMNMATALATGMVNVRNIIKTKVPAVPGSGSFSSNVSQMKTGGFQVVGPDDKKTYQASFLDQQGGLVGKKGANIVLGGEEGEEYWINHSMMKMPVISEIANALEGLRTHKFSEPDFTSIVQKITANRQFKNGGASSGKSLWIPKGNQEPDDLLQNVYELLNKLQDSLDNPKPSVALLDYDYFKEESDFMDSIKEYAKG
jgi:TP901 family phage tail tape measure protein